MEESLTPLYISIGTNNHNRIYRILILITLTFTITLFFIYELPIQNYSNAIKWKLNSEYKNLNPCKYGPKGPRIYCAVLTHSGSLQKAQAVKKTWGKYMNYYLIRHKYIIMDIKTKREKM